MDPNDKPLTMAPVKYLLRGPGTDNAPDKLVPRDVTPENLPDLVGALTKAHGAAMGAHATREDNGTCNMDAPVLCVKNVRLAKAAVKLAGGTCWEWKRGKRMLGLVLGFPSGGQAAKRTAFAEAFAKELEARGWSASVFYMVD